MYMSQPLQPPIITMISNNRSGQSVAIIVGVHGNEKGPQYEWDWLNALEIQSGTLYVIFANPTAGELNKRFVNVNLNRRFGNGTNEFPEDDLARAIEQVLDQCVALLDLHMYNEAMDRPFVICSERSNHIAKILPANYIVNIPNDVNGGGTDDYMASHGKVGVCFETGSVNRPTEYSSIIRNGVLSFLGMFGLVEHEVQENKHAKILVKEETKIVTNPDIRFSKEYSSFDLLKADEIICTEAGKKFTAKQDGYILFPRPNNPVGAEAYYTLIEE